MSESFVIAVAQINPIVGDIDGNIALIRAARSSAAAKGADLVVFSELVVTGYPPEDLILKPMFYQKTEDAVRALASETSDNGPSILIGAPWREHGKLYNAALLLSGGEITARRYKFSLPNYGVFDEVRVFEQGPLPGPISIGNIRLGVMICEDMWVDEVSECLMESGADILVVINGSPFEKSKTEERLSNAVARVVETGLPLIYVNQVGGQDELVFDGGSFILSSERHLCAQSRTFSEDLTLSVWSLDSKGNWICTPNVENSNMDSLASIYHAMVLGLRDYVIKNSFPGVLIGLSGGVDSALSAAVAVDALGPDCVRCVRMPSKYTSQPSFDDSAASIKLLGLKAVDIDIGPAVTTFDNMLSDVFEGRDSDSTEENIQARVRGIILMAMSNKLGYMVLTTGNKSEMSIGYATLYGDMCGGYSVLKDVYKTVAYELAKWRNENWFELFKGPNTRVVPENVLTKRPSAELRPDQFDEDTLPPYDILDDILECLIEYEMPVSEIAERGHEIETIAQIWGMLDTAEYKRRQSPPGVKLTGRALSKDRRYPITNRFRYV